MSVFDKIMKEQYPHGVEILCYDVDERQSLRGEINRWCRDNIYEWDVALLYEFRQVVGLVIRCTNMDDWMLAKIRWMR